MSRRRKALATLMRARMLAAGDESSAAAASSSAQSSGASDIYPSSSSSPMLGDSNNISVRPAALVKDVIKLVDTSISNSHGDACVAGTTIQDFLQAYANLSYESRCEFLLDFAREYDVDRAHVHSLMQQYLSLRSSSLFDVDGETHPDSLEDGCPLSTLYRIERNLREAIKPQYAIFIEQLNAYSGGLKLLVDLRADLLSLLKEKNAASLRALDIFLKEKLMTWLSPATLELHQITWDDSASLLEKIVAYEAVHPIRNLLDLKRRLSTGRRCFGYLHPAMPGQPLIFIEVALLKNMSHSVQEVLWDNPPIPEYQAECALFYSISSTQPGLSGINLGRFLIKRVIELIIKEMPHISTFATLSPIPGYMQWLQSKLVHHSNLTSPFTESVSEDRPNSTFSENILHPEEERQLMDSCLGYFSGKNGMEVMLKLLASPKKEWVKNDQLLTALMPPLMRLCARYLIKEKKRGKALDVVANFHLQNGAMIERINWMADTSDKGFSESGSIMVNYMYRPDQIEENAQAYSKMGKIQTSHDLQLYLI